MSRGRRKRSASRCSVPWTACRKCSSACSWRSPSRARCRSRIPGDDQIRAMFIAALGCNLAWGLVDAVMYLVRTLADRGRYAHARPLRASRPRTRNAAARSSGNRSRETCRSSSRRRRSRPFAGGSSRCPPCRRGPSSIGADLLAALAIFLIVVASTFPVVLPFAFIQDIATAKNVSRAIALAMLFFGGLALGRYAGYGSRRVGFMMVGWARCS